MSKQIKIRKKNKTKNPTRVMFMPAILELCKLRWEDFCKFKATLGYRLRPCLRKTHKTTMFLKKPPNWLGRGGVQLSSQLLAGRGR